MKYLKSAIVIFAIIFTNNLFAQKTNDTTKGYVFKEDFRLPATSVKNQYRSGTCWSFSGLSFLESEMLRK
ncbi:MAG: aminopeptidase, partial [Bacteroidales bacterium]|nr:aminopeptidase [Bacteroidales bacterium]